MEDLVARRSTAADRLMQGRRAREMAEGTLIGVRRCPPDAAFDELVGAARKYRIPIFRIASALVQLASGDDQRAESITAPNAVALREWKDLLDGSS